MATNFIEDGYTLKLTPAADVASGHGYLFGASLFGVALSTVAANTAGSFATDGVFRMAKTSALAIAVGDRLFWDPTNKVVNKTSAGQQQVGVAVEAASNPSSTVLMKIVSALPAAT